MMRKFSALILVLIFAVSFVSSAHAADITLSSAVVINSSNQSQYNGKSIGGTIPASSHAGTFATFYSSAGIVIDGVEINLTIDGLNTDYSELYSTCSGIALRNGAKLHLTVKGTNTLKAGFGGAGIAVPDGCTLEITGSSTGTLNAIGGNNYGGGAGIGSIGNGASANSDYRYMIPQGLGDIIINGGTINAQGGTWYYTSAVGGAAGIGSSEFSGAGLAVQGTTFSDHRYITNLTGSVTINGGNVSATGGPRATGIGGGNIGTLKTITITGGTVTANGGKWAAAVGCGDNNNYEGLICPEISITGGNLTANGNIGYGERDTGIPAEKITIGSGAILKCTGSINPFEASTVPDNSYVNADGNLQQAQNVSSVWGKEDLTSGWWVVDKYTEVNNRIIITGTVNLILNDGVTLKASKGIQVYKGNTLNIYTQMNGTGKIEAYSVAQNSGIGGGYIEDKSGTNKDYSCGTINIYGGTIESHGGGSASGISCGLVHADTTDGGTVNIYGGTVRAWGVNYGAGIGCGYAQNSAKYTNLHAVNIYGGTVEAYGGMAASGIGGGNGAPGGNITITGGNVTAQHGYYYRAGKGIGEGYNGSGGTVSLSLTNITDSISATSYGGTVTLNSSFMLQDSTTEATTDNIGGKTIVPPVSVSFNANGGSGTMNSVKTAYGYEYTLPECTFTPADGMIFSKWLVGDVEYEPGGSFDVTADTVVKALWKYGSRTVTFNANAHGTAPTSQTVDYGAKLTEPAAPTAEGWTFGGWYKESSCVNRWEFASETVTENRTLYAKWSENAYTISYELDGGINSANNPLSYMTTENFTLTEPTKTGYTFSGWTYDGQTTPTKNVTINGGTGNKTFTAHWTVNQYTITFDADGGSEVASVTYNYTRT